jgi:hypothetical protein
MRDSIYYFNLVIRAQWIIENIENITELEEKVFGYKGDYQYKNIPYFVWSQLLPDSGQYQDLLLTLDLSGPSSSSFSGILTRESELHGFCNHICEEAVKHIYGEKFIVSSMTQENRGVKMTFNHIFTPFDLSGAVSRLGLGQ